MSGMAPTLALLKHLRSITILTVLLGAVVLACASQQEPRATSPTLTRLVRTGEPGGPAVEIDLSRGVHADKNAGRMEGWFGYAVTRRHWRLKRFQERLGKEVAYQYTFEEELESRSNAAQIWGELSAQKKLTDPYFADLERVRAAGFMREYVWTCVPHPDWAEPAGIRHAEFARWLSLQLPHHQVETWVTVLYGEARDRWIVGVEAHPRRHCSGSTSTP
jgi:hypothetical protein